MDIKEKQRISKLFDGYIEENIKRETEAYVTDVMTEKEAVKKSCVCGKAKTESIDNHPKIEMPTANSLSAIQNMIIEECDKIKEMLLDKNQKYGNSALSPKRIFSKQNSVEQIKVRIDDKLSRISNISSNPELVDEDDSEKDLIGYMILLRIAKRLNN